MMNTTKKVITGLTALAVLGSSALVSAPSASAQTPPPPFPGMHRGGERHPELRRALANLRKTEYDLRHAASDFDGHKAKAADLCHAAQDQILLAIQSDRN